MPAEGQRRIDWALRYKINLILADFSHGDFRLNAFPEYVAVTRSLNRYARARGIHLMYGGLTSFGMANRITYPDGDTYSCWGSPNQTVRVLPVRS